MRSGCRRGPIWASRRAFSSSAPRSWSLGWRMPTYADQGGEIYTAPGLVPSFYGLVIGLLSLWLGARALRAGALAPGVGRSRADRPSGNSNARFGARGRARRAVHRRPDRPHAVLVAAAIFVTLFVAIFEWRPGLCAGRRARRARRSRSSRASSPAFLVTLVFERSSSSDCPEATAARAIRCRRPRAICLRRLLSRHLQRASGRRSSASSSARCRA